MWLQNKMQIILRVYCGCNDSEPFPVIWNDETNFFGSCFFFTFILCPVYLLCCVHLAYMIGVIRLPDALDHLIRRRRRKEKLIASIELIALLGTLIAFLLDIQHNLISRNLLSYASGAFVFFKTLSLIFYIYYTYKSFACFNYSVCRLITLNILIFLYLLALAARVFWIYTLLKLPWPHCSSYGYVHAQFILVVTYASLFNYAHFNEHRHSLYYESFADATINRSEIFMEIEEASGGFFTRISFRWVQPLLKKAVANQLKNTADILHIPYEMSTRIVYEKVHKLGQTLFPQQTPILWRLLWKSFKTELTLVSNLKAIGDFLNFANPLLLNALIIYLETNEKSWIGLVYAAGLLICSLTSSICVNLFDFYVNNVALKVRCALLAAIYRKTLRLNADHLHEKYSKGELMTLTSVDIERVMGVCSTLIQLISMPTQIALSLYLLYRQLGIASLSGFVFSLIVLPINKLICIQVGKLTEKLMQHKDARVKSTSQLISSIKVIKMNHWQDLFVRRIKEERSKEISYVKKRKYLDAVCVYFWATTPVLISVLTFSTYVMLGNKLTSPVVFSSLTLLNMLINPLNSLPWVVQGCMEAWVSAKRLQKFFELKDADQVINCDSQLEENELLHLEEVCFSRNFSNLFTLGPLNLSIKRGQLIGIIGGVGSGKSTFLQSLLGEIPRADKNGIFSIHSDVKKNGIGYVSQNPWIQNDSVKKNILFGRNYEYKAYNEVLEACALKEELSLYDEYDNLTVGDRGVSLSGGQKARLALARAMYQNFDLYLLDDPFSSLDVHVANHVYENCINGILKQKTRIICTHHHQYLKEADLIILFDKGVIIRVGSPNEVLDALTKRKKSVSRLQAQSIDLQSKVEHIEKSFFQEEMNEGVVQFSVYFKYFKAIGITLFSMIICFILLMQFTRSFSDVWLSIWINAVTQPKYEFNYYLKVFFICAASNSVLAMLRSFLYAYGGIRASINTHDNFFKSIIKCKLSFFNIRPFGQVINRFSSDIFHIDENLPFTLNIFLSQIVVLVATLLVTSYGLWMIILIIILLVYPYYLIQNYYRFASRDLKRISSNTQSPIYSHFSESLDGLTTIKCYNANKRFCAHLDDCVDLNNTANYSLKACSQWLNLRLQIIGVGVSSSVAFFAVLLHQEPFITVNPSMIGLALSYALSITNILNNVIQSFTQLEMDMVFMERLVQYIESTEKEDERGVQLAHFPQHGSVEFKNVFFRYNENQNFALEDVSFTVKAQEFIGIVGRTGGGKSSIFQCLFRLFELEQGRILVDGQDISQLSLESLRQNMHIIPQDAFLFDGKVRFNLDPYHLRTDEEIWKAIEECDAQFLILKLGGLNGVITDQGRNLSAGEKQLICLTRALLNKVKILCLDEATSSIDESTELNLQTKIKKAFRFSTIFLVAHKINSVLNCDRIIVIDNGRIGEMNTPEKLIQDPKSLFFKMWSSMEQK